MSHAAIVCREYGIPAVTGTAYATSKLRNGDMIRVDGKPISALAVVTVRLLRSDLPRMSHDCDLAMTVRVARASRWDVPASRNARCPCRPAVATVPTGPLPGNGPVGMQIAGHTRAT